MGECAGNERLIALCCWRTAFLVFHVIVQRCAELSLVRRSIECVQCRGACFPSGKMPVMCQASIAAAGATLIYVPQKVCRTISDGAGE